MELRRVKDYVKHRRNEIDWGKEIEEAISVEEESMVRSYDDLATKVRW